MFDMMSHAGIGRRWVEAKVGRAGRQSHKSSFNIRARVCVPASRRMRLSFRLTKRDAPVLFCFGFINRCILTKASIVNRRNSVTFGSGCRS